MRKGIAELTKDTLKAFKIIYCEFKSRRKAGFSKEDSRLFPDGGIESLPAFSNWLKQDLDSAIEELENAGFLKENVVGDIKISDEGLIFMENKPKDAFNELSKLFDIASLFI